MAGPRDRADRQGEPDPVPGLVGGGAARHRSVTIGRHHRRPCAAGCVPRARHRCSPVWGRRCARCACPTDLDGLDGLVIPGGESTTMGKLMGTFGLIGAVAGVRRERPVLGTCAGLIMLAQRTTDGDQPLLGVMDITVRRNAFGRQVHSFEAPVDVRLPGGRERRSSRACSSGRPGSRRSGAGVELVAIVEGHVVGVRQDHLVGLAFHPELTDDDRVHAVLLATWQSASASRPARWRCGRVKSGGDEYVWAFQVGGHQAQEGHRRRQARARRSASCRGPSSWRPGGRGRP